MTILVLLSSYVVWLLSGACIFGEVDVHYNTTTGLPDNYQTTYAKPKLSSMILFLMHSGGKFREAIHCVDRNDLKSKLVTPVYKLANPYCLTIGNEVNKLPR